MKTKIMLSITALFMVSLLQGCSPTELSTIENQNQTQPTSTQVQTQNPNTMNTENQMDPPKTGDKVAVIETDLGTIKFKLFPTSAPEMSKNFEELTKSGKYNNVPFHRVITDFMIQTGDFTNKNGTGGYSYKGEGTELPDEIVPSFHHFYGTVSMANAGPNTNGSQFFIVTNKDGAADLDGNYSIFGQVYEGMDVALKIAALQEPGSGGEGTPTKIVNMKKVMVTTY